MRLDLDHSRGHLILSDDDGYRLVLRPVGRTAELLYKILVERQMGNKKLGTEGAPIQSSISLTEQIDLIRKRKAEEARQGLPASDLELDL